MKKLKPMSIKKVIKKVGGQRALARICGVKQPSVWAWKNKGTLLDGDRCILVELADVGLTRYDIRPDMFGTKPLERAS